MSASEIAPGVFRLVLPLGIHGIPSVNAYLLADDGGDTLVDCGISVTQEGPHRPDDDGTGFLQARLAECGSSLERLARLVVTHAHIDHYGLAGEVVRRSDADLWMHVESRLDIAKYEDPASAVERRQSMLADHGLYGEELEDASSGLRRWMPVMPSIGRPRTQLSGGETFTASGRRWEVVPTPGHSPGHVCLWAAGDRLLCSGDHLLKGILPPVTYERGFEVDPMGSYLDSLETVRALAPELVLPGHGDVFADGAARAEAIGRNKRRRVGQVQDLLEAGDRSVTDVTGVLFRQQLSSSQLHFAMAEVLAYLAYLEARGLAHRLTRPGGGFLWRAGARSA